MTSDLSPVRRSGDLMRDVRRFGLQSAASVVDRYVDVIERHLNGEQSLGPVEAFATRADSALDGFTGSTWQAGLRLLEAIGRPGADLAGTLRLPPAAPGTSSEASFWIHNLTSAVVASEFYASVLVSPSDDRIPASAVSFLPSTVGSLEAGGSRQVVVRASVPPDQLPGRYRGLLMGTATPDGTLTLLLDVVDPEPS